MSSTNHQNPLILKHYQHYFAKYYFIMILLVPVGAVASLVGTSLLAHPEMLQWTMQQWREALAIQWQYFWTSSLFYLHTLFWLLVVLQFLYILFRYWYERIELSPQGIRYVPPLPSGLRFIPWGWQFSWQEIKAVNTKPAWKTA